MRWKKYFITSDAKRDGDSTSDFVIELPESIENVRKIGASNVRLANMTQNITSDNNTLVFGATTVTIDEGWYVVDDLVTEINSELTTATVGITCAVDDQQRRITFENTTGSSITLQSTGTMNQTIGHTTSKIIGAGLIVTGNLPYDLSGGDFYFLIAKNMGIQGWTGADPRKKMQVLADIPLQGSFGSYTTYKERIEEYEFITFPNLNQVRSTQEFCIQDRNGKLINLHGTRISFTLHIAIE